MPFSTNSRVLSSGKGKVTNPYCIYFSAAMLLDYLKLDVADKQIEETVEHAVIIDM